MNIALLSIYLNDHLAMMTGETELAQRTASENEGSPLGLLLHRYVGEVNEQKHCVEHLIRAVGEEPSVAKQAAAWVMEKMGRLKMNNSLTRYSDLSRLLELESLICAADARLHLWQSLKPHDTNTMFSTASGDFARYLTETKRQREALQGFHAEVSGKALGIPYSEHSEANASEEAAAN